MRAIYLILGALFPVTMLVFGYLLRFRTPKTINAVFGYRTKRSRCSNEAWAFANKSCGGLMLAMGAFSLPATMAVLLLSFRRDWMLTATILSVYANIALIVLTIPITEKRLKDALKGDRRDPP